MNNNKIGLALSGGGARGAYQVGVARYLAENNITPDVYSGASIGALNATIMAASETIGDGTEHLARIWGALKEDEMLRLSGDIVLWGLLFAVARLSRNPWAYLLYKMIENKGIAEPDVLQSILRDELNIDKLASGKPLFISAYRSSGMLEDIFSIMLAEAGLRDTGKSEFFHIQTLPKEDQLKLIMSSAALPVIFGTQEINGKNYRDGGIGGWQTCQGNTPVTPLKESGCKWAIVVHLSDGSLWDRGHFDQDMNIIEIRPEKSIHPEGSITTLMKFSPERIKEWMTQGYEDASRCLGNVINALRLAHMGEAVKKNMDTAINGLVSDDFDAKLGLL